MTTRSFQTVVIGGGPGGYVAGIKLGQLGVDAALIEKAKMGGVCLNWGCIPSKALIHVAHTVRHFEEAEAFGVSAQGVKLDPDKARAWKDEIVGKLTGGVRKLVKDNGCKILEGRARFLSNRSLELTTSAGETEKIDFEKCIVATGARPIEIPGMEIDGELIWGADHALNLPTIPERLLIVGGGIIGLELGTVYAKLGTSVTIVEMLDGILTGIDRDLVRLVERRLKQFGGRALTQSKVAGIDRVEGELRVTVDAKGKEEIIECDRMLVAAGFSPNTAGIDLDAAGVKTGEKGEIEIDDALRTNVEGIYAVGDVTGPPYLAHRAFKMGEVAAEHAAGMNVSFDVRAMPSAIFTDPEIATTGLSEEEARKGNHEIKTGKFMLAANGRALGTGEPLGFVKTIVDAKTGILLGAGIVGHSASELIGELTLAIEMGASAEDIGLTVHPHPTISEAVQESALASLGKATHAINKRERPARGEKSAPKAGG